MPIDPRIALGVQQSTFDPAAAMQNALAIRNARLQEQANQLKIQQEQQAMQEAAGLQNYLASADLSKPEGITGLLKYGTSGATMAKTIAERQAAEALTTQRGEEAKKSKFEAASKRQEFVNQAMQDMAANPSDANITAWAQDSVLQGLFAQDEADSLLQQTLAIPLDQRKSVFTQLGMSGAQKSEAERRAAQTEIDKEQLKISKGNLAVSQAREAREAENQRRANDPTFQASLAEAKKRGELIAQGDVTAMQTLPGTIQKAESAINIIDQMIGKRIPETDAKGNIIKDKDGNTIYLPDTPENSKQYSKNRHVGFETAVGAGLPFASKIPGTNAANFTAMHDQVTSQAFLQAYETLRGTGSIATKEGEKATAAITRMNRSQSEDEYVKAAREFQDAVEKMVANARTKASTAQSKTYGTQTPAAGTTQKGATTSNW